NQSTTVWKDGTYDASGRLTGFSETTTDAFGLTTQRSWSNGTYEKNPFYVSNEKTPHLSEYTLSGYHEEVTDSRGQKTVRDWTNATYNQFGELTSYNEVTQKNVDGQTLTQTLRWSGAAYNEFGQLLQYNEEKTGFD